MINRLRWHLHELDPELELPARSLSRLSRLDGLAAWLVEQPPAAARGLITRLAAELVVDIRALSVRINALEREIAQRVEMVAPQLLELPGCAALTTAKIVGETANIARFRSEACFAMHAGVAPIPASSGRTQRHRLARGGNRQLNAALHRIALTQVGMSGGPGHTYYQRRRAKGDRVRNTVTAGWACTPPPPSTTAPPKPSATSAPPCSATPTGRTQNGSSETHPSRRSHPSTRGSTRPTRQRNRSVNAARRCLNRLTGSGGPAYAGRGRALRSRVSFVKTPDHLVPLR
jgi:hypothetical protein